MKKKLSPVLTLVLMLSLAACGGRTDPPANSNTPPAVTSPDTPSAGSTTGPEPSDTTEPAGDSPATAGDGSGIRLSRYVFTFLPGLGSAATARRLHMLASYWGLVLMGLHLGLHWGMMAARFRRRLGGKGDLFLQCAGTAAGLYGVYAVWKHQVWLYLSLRSEFLLFDFDEPAALYFLDHFCMMVLFIFLSHGVVSLWRDHRKGAAET